MALVNGYIKNDTGQPIPFATVSVVDGNFNPTNEITSANVMGYFSLEVDPYNEPYALQITSIGYKPTGVKLSSWINGNTVRMAIDAKDLSNVTVYATKKKFPVWLLALLAIVLIKK